MVEKEPTRRILKPWFMICALLGIAVVIFCVFRATEKNTTVSEDDKAFRSESSLSPSEREPTARTSNVVAQKEASQVYAPQGGTVVEGHEGRDLETDDSQKELFRREIAMKIQDIEIAREDIVNLEQELDEIRQKIVDAEIEYENTAIEFRQELIDEAALNEQQAELDRLKMHLEATEEMLETKFRNIAEYEDRIKELQQLTAEQAGFEERNPTFH